MHIDKRRLYHLDWFLILNGAALLAVGMVNLISASTSIESGPYNLLIKQMLALVAGIGVIILILAYDYRLVAGYSRHFYVATLLFIVDRPRSGDHSGRGEEVDHGGGLRLSAVGIDEAGNGASPREYAQPKEKGE